MTGCVVMFRHRRGATGGAVRAKEPHGSYHRSHWLDLAGMAVFGTIGARCFGAAVADLRDDGLFCAGGPVSGGGRVREPFDPRAGVLDR